MNQKTVFTPKGNQTPGQAKALGLGEQLTELRKELLTHTVATDNSIRPMKQKLEYLQEAVNAIVDILGTDTVAKRLDERRIIRLEIQDEQRRGHIVKLLELKRIEEEKVVRGPTDGDMGSFISVVEFPPGGGEEPIAGSFTFMPIGAGQPKELLEQFIGKEVGYEVHLGVPVDPETNEPEKDDKGNPVIPGKLLLLGIYKQLPPPEAKPETPAAPAPAPDAPPAAETAAQPTAEATAG